MALLLLMCLEKEQFTIHDVHVSAGVVSQLNPLT